MATPAASDITTERGSRGLWLRAPQAARRSSVARGESTLTLRGTRAELLWNGLRPAVWLQSWAIFKVEGEWRLTATIARVDGFTARQRPLLFTAPRPGGFWVWPLVSLELGDRQLRATLGPQER